LGQAWVLFWPKRNFKDGRLIIWTIGWDLIALEMACKKTRETKKTDVVFNPTFVTLRFYIHVYIHVGNMLLVDDTPYKKMFNSSYGPIFLELFMAFMGRINICWVQFSLTWKIFICLDTMFPPLLKIILLVGLDVFM
jgi:hypothetical protein